MPNMHYSKVMYLKVFAKEIKSFHATSLSHQKSKFSN